MKKEKKIVVFESDDCIYDFPDTPVEFIKWWEEKFNLAPLEYRESLRIDCSTSEYYDSPQLEVKIYYSRLETDDEYAVRLNKEQQENELRKNKELSELKRLRDKYNV